MGYVITITEKTFVEYASEVSDEITNKLADPINKLMFKEAVELFMNDLTKKLFRKEG